MKVQFRPATQDDLGFLYRVREAAFRPYVETWDEAEVRQALARWFGEQEFSIVIGDGVPVGFVALSRGDEGWTLHGLMILPEAQGRGYGGRALDLLLAQARSADRSVELRVRRSNPRARAFYERRGFVTNGEMESHVTIKWQRSQEPTGDMMPPFEAPNVFGREFFVSLVVTVTLFGSAWKLAPLLPPLVGLAMGLTKIVLRWHEAEPRRRWATVRFAPWMWPPLGGSALSTLFYFGLTVLLRPPQGEDAFYTLALNAFFLMVYGFMGLFVSWLGARR